MADEQGPLAPVQLEVAGSSGHASCCASVSALGTYRSARCSPPARPDPDGSWPCLAVRELLERLQSPEVERGLENEIFNSLGVTTRGLLDGGQLDRDRAQQYREQAERFYDRWPRTAAVLNEAADSFERAARRYDNEAERRWTGLE